MSGGHLTDCTGGLYQLRDWADMIDPQNPVLADLLRDMYGLLDRYDYWMSGDIGAEDASEAWAAFRGKWLTDDTSHIEELLGKRMEDIMASFRRGYVEEGP